MTNTKLPWRPGGARGGEEPERHQNLIYVFTCGHVEVENGFAGTFPPWAQVECWMLKSEFMLTVPPRQVSDCEVCGRPFELTYSRSDRIHCSGACRSRAYRKRLKGLPTEGESNGK